MLQLPRVLAAVAVTFLSWGVYGVLLHNGKNAMGESSLRPFVAVGVAYFFIAVVGSIVLMMRKPEKGQWTMAGALLSIFAGSIGALGALGVILALKYKGSPMYVMPLVFGGAPVVNTLVTSWLGKTFSQIKPMFIVGLVLVALGAVGVLVNKPPAPAHAAASHDAGAGHADAEKKTDDTKSGTKSEETKADASKKEKDDAKASSDSANKNDAAKSVVKADPLKITLSIIMAIICWGGYGPFLHLGQMKMSGSRLRPFLCVGIAYFIIAVAVPLALLNYLPDPEPGNWGTVGFLWSFAAGSAGAIGALGIIMAFNFGGKPIYVMPLIFGFAPVVNTIVTMLLSNSFGQTNVFFLLSLAIVIGGAVTVLIFAPKSAPHGAAGHKPDAKPASPAGSEAGQAEGGKRNPFERKSHDDENKLGQSPGSNPLAPPNS